MSADKLRRALLAQKQRIDGAQQQQQQQHSGAQASSSRAATAALPRPAAVKQTKRKAEALEEDLGDSQSKRRSTDVKPPPPAPTAAVAPAPARALSRKNKKHKEDQSSVAIPAPVRPNQPSLAMSALSAKLASSRFRWLNEQLYTLPSAAAFAHFSAHPSDYSAYHTGFRQQVQRWPQHPLDAIIAHLGALTTPHVIADMGCGDARLAATLLGGPHTVHSFDLVRSNPLVTAANIRALPLPAASVDTAVYCLSLMGTDYGALLGEGLRVLRAGGELVVAEVSSRLVEGGGVEGFVQGLEAMGLRRRKVVDNDYFALVWCTKEKPEKLTGPAGAKNRKGRSAKGGTQQEQRAKVVLTPCIYKKR